jgi:hypothetical protein
MLSSNTKVYKHKVSKCQNEINLLKPSETLFPVENSIDLSLLLVSFICSP